VENATPGLQPGAPAARLGFRSIHFRKVPAVEDRPLSSTDEARKGDAHVQDHNHIRELSSCCSTGVDGL
jgi:hypothetical protein